MSDNGLMYFFNLFVTETGLAFFYLSKHVKKKRKRTIQFRRQFVSAWLKACCGVFSFEKVMHSGLCLHRLSWQLSLCGVKGALTSLTPRVSLT